MKNNRLTHVDVRTTRTVKLHYLSLSDKARAPTKRLTTSLGKTLRSPRTISLIVGDYHRIALRGRFVPTSIVQRTIRQTNHRRSIVQPKVSALTAVRSGLARHRTCTQTKITDPRTIPVSPTSPNTTRTTVKFPVILGTQFNNCSNGNAHATHAPRRFRSCHSL